MRSNGTKENLREWWLRTISFMLHFGEHTAVTASRDVVVCVTSNV